jgi:hypothetical protein
MKLIIVVLLLCLSKNTLASHNPVNTGCLANQYYSAGKYETVTTDIGTIVITGAENLKEASPTFADIDGDGHVDMIVGDKSGGIQYYQNDGGNPYKFTTRTGAANPFGHIAVGALSAPALADIDNDGDFDLVVGEYDSVINYYENTGNNTVPTFTARTGAANPFDSISLAQGTPTFADLDNDDDFDLIVGQNPAKVFYYENTGNNTVPTFTARTGDANSGVAKNPFYGITVDYNSVPALADLDGDDDFDLILGRYGGGLDYYENTGSRTAPVFAARIGDANPFNGIYVGLNSAPAFFDINNDGKQDLVVGNQEYVLQYYPNSGIFTCIDWTVPNDYTDGGCLLACAGTSCTCNTPPTNTITSCAVNEVQTDGGCSSSATDIKAALFAASECK